MIFLLGILSAALVLVIVGVAMIYPPAAFIVAGVGIGAIVLFVDDGTTEDEA